MSLPERFPEVTIDEKEDYNPGIRLFGKRFIKDQTILEYLSEFLAVLFSDKMISQEEISTPLPSFHMIQNWPKREALYYKPPIKLNLKLFALLSVSRIDARHQAHKEQYKRLHRNLKEKITYYGQGTNIVELLEEFLRGLQGAGFDRAWCAQTFFPMSKSLITKETIWNETKARGKKDLTWFDTLNSDYYSTRRAFLARGGELLYIHLCNAFLTDQDKVNTLGEKMLSIAPNSFASEEFKIDKLHSSLQAGFQRLQGPFTETVDRLVDCIESLDQETHNKINQNKMLSCQWCPRDSWQEGLIFAIELNRLLSAGLDPIERLELLMNGCALHVLRSLSAQSQRYAENVMEPAKNLFGYAWIFTANNTSVRQNKIVAQRNLETLQSMIYQAVHIKELQENARKDPNKKHTVEKLLKEADNKYGFKLFLSLGKNLGIISPKKGPGARFVMTDRVLRYLVLVLVPPGQRCTYEDFLQRLYLHFGIAVEENNLIDATMWSGFTANQSVQAGSWLQDMLSAGGFLIKLSDSHSIVHNPFEIVQ